MAGQISDLVNAGIKLHAAQQAARDAARDTAALINPDRIPAKPEGRPAQHPQPERP